MSIEAMKQTFDFLYDLWEMKQTARSDRHKKVMWELDRAIGKAEKQRPVGWWNGRETAWFEHESDRPVDDCTIPLYTAPRYYPNEGHAHIEWIGLTDEEIVYEWELWRASVPRYVGFARGIEAKLKEKNHG